MIRDGGSTDTSKQGEFLDRLTLVGAYSNWYLTNSHFHTNTMSLLSLWNTVFGSQGVDRTSSNLGLVLHVGKKNKTWLVLS